MKEQIKSGYKQTEVGVIPEDWEVKKLGELVKNVEYGSSAKSQLEGKIPVLRMGNLQDGKINWDSLVFTSDETEINRYLLKYNDVLFNRTNTVDLVGKTSIYKGENPAIFAGYLIRVNRMEHLLDADYLNYVLNAEFSRKYSQLVLSIAVGQANINGQKLKTYPIPLPPIAEQEKIAEALSDVDSLIESLEEAIAKKRHIKQGAMQELLTGKRRLIDNGEWKNLSLGELFVFKNGLNKSKEYFGYGTPIVNYMDVFKYSSFVSSDLQGRVSLSNQEIQNFGVKKGDVFFTRTSETPEEIGMASVILDNPSQTVFSGFILRARPINDDLFDGFKAYCFRSNYIRSQIISKASYTTRALTNGRILSAVILKVPPKAEQEAIASVLTDMDNEITALEEKLNKTRQLKQGMMQELLTGKTRLI